MGTHQHTLAAGIIAQLPFWTSLDRCLPHSPLSLNTSPQMWTFPKSSSKASFSSWLSLPIVGRLPACLSGGLTIISNSLSSQSKPCPSLHAPHGARPPLPGSQAGDPEVILQPVTSKLPLLDNSICNDFVSPLLTFSLSLSYFRFFILLAWPDMSGSQLSSCLCSLTPPTYTMGFCQNDLTRSYYKVKLPVTYKLKSKMKFLIPLCRCCSLEADCQQENSMQKVYWRMLLGDRL